MRLKIHGPNLQDQTKGDFVAHAADCKDNSKVKYLFGSDQEGQNAAWEIEADTVREVVEAVYEDFIFHNDKDPWMSFVSDIHFAPCCDGLPTTKRGRPKKVNPATAALRRNVTGAIERGEAEAIVEQPAPKAGRKGDEPIKVGDHIPYHPLEGAAFLVVVQGVGKSYVDILIRERTERFHREPQARITESMFKEVRA